MALGINNVKDLVETIVLVLGILSIFYGVYSFKISKSHFYFSVIISCTERFQLLMIDLKHDCYEKRMYSIKKYLDLCNEELFYFQHHYLPKEIIEEWLEGMMYYLPHFFNNNNINDNSSYLNEIEEHQLLDDYPRIKKTFRVSKKYNLANEKDRQLMIKELLKNLKGI